MRSAALFGIGAATVGVGAALHVPMFVMGRTMDYRLAGMPMDDGMYWGMALIALGSVMAAAGLLPSKAGMLTTTFPLQPPSDPRLRPAHWRLMGVLAVALVVDVMKPASLGFVIPGLRAEYDLSASQAALLPFTALTGTFVGSAIWGYLADRYGRRASILLSCVLFTGTTICGAMPSFGWNLAMCFVMGAAAGGLLPIAYALLAECLPRKHRGWSLVLVGGLGAIGGYFAASLASAWLQPVFGWRIMWFMNLPTGLLVVALSRLMPESPEFLAHIGRADLAVRSFQAFGWRPLKAETSGGAPPVEVHPSRSTGWVLWATGLAWSFVNFGVLLWLPARLVSLGQSIGGASQALASSSLLAIPAVILAAVAYAKWSAKGAVVGSMIVTAAGLGGVAVFTVEGGGPVAIDLSVAALLFGSSAMLATLLPFAAEVFPVSSRGVGTGGVAAATKLGGVIAQGLGLLAFVPVFSTVTWGVAAMTMLLAMILARVVRPGEGMAQLGGVA